MQAEVKLTDEGQITVPQPIQRALGAKLGDTLVFETADDGVRIRVRRPTSFHAYAGINRQGVGQSITDVVAEIREMRGD